MKTLFLDLASNHGSIACVDKTSVLHLTSLDHRIDDAALTGLIEQVIKEAGWTYQDLEGIACVVGPGGFTSLRVGVATANALGDALGIPVCGVHLSEVYQAKIPLLRCGYGGQANPNSKIPNTLWLHSTKRTELFIRSKDFPKPQCISVQELERLLSPHPALRATLSPSGEKEQGKVLFWMGELIPEQQKIVTDAGVIAAPLRPLAEVLPGFLGGQEYKKQILEPWYGRGW